MGTALKSLIRLNGWRVDEKRRKLSELSAALEHRNDEATRLQREIDEEQAVAKSNPTEVGLTYPAYVRIALERRARAAEAIARAEADVISAHDELGEAYRELRKLELVDEGRQRREVAERDRREQLILDELGVQSHMRKRRAGDAER